MLYYFMGLCQSEEEKKQFRINQEIDDKLRDAFNVEKTIIKLLLLGAGDCGKSTIIKQMKILHSNGFNEQEIFFQKLIVYSNIVKAMNTLIKASRFYGYTFSDMERENDIEMVLGVVQNSQETEPFSPELALALKRLWADPAISVYAYEKGHEFNLQDATKYFMENLDRISSPTYIPNGQDILYTRLKTTGIVEVPFTIKNVKFRVIDVGGQRSERKKWIHSFENVQAIIYIVAISEYDQMLLEDGKTNRLHESLRIFKIICNLKWFVNSSIILFLNKKDLFGEKIETVSLQSAFPKYDGPQTYDDCIDYIRDRFLSKNKNKLKTIYTHQTCATNTDQIQVILDSVLDMVIQANLRQSGFY